MATAVDSRRIRLALPVLVLAATLLGGPLFAASENWFVSFERIDVPPVARSNTTQLVDVGTFATDGFSELVFSLGGEFNEGIPTSGVVGAILIPDIEMFDYLLRSEGQFIFPLEVTVGADRVVEAIFVSEQQTARVAFPSYRVYLYNETTSGASVNLYIYRTRR
jgi:hypothetical protein